MNDGGPAFPTTWYNDSEEIQTAPNGAYIAPEGSVQIPGMSLLDWFAGQAQISEDFHISLAVALGGPVPAWEDDPLAFAQWIANWQAKWRYMQAEAMLAERERRVKK